LLHTQYIYVTWARNESSVLQLHFNFPCLLWSFGYIAISSIITDMIDVSIQSGQSMTALLFGHGKQFKSYTKNT